MSSVVVEVVRIEAIRPHTNADRLFLAQIKGWQTVIRKLEDGSPEFAVGERVVYIPPDATLSRELAERLRVGTYLSEKTSLSGERELVVRRVRLRGEPSYGLVVRPDDPCWPVGADVKEHYGIGKYMPPVRYRAGDSEANHPLFERYTDIENLRHFPDLIEDGVEIVVTEKIHGTNLRIGVVEGKTLAGSHGLQRRRPEPENLAAHTYWFPILIPSVAAMLEALGQRHRQAILFGEAYGSRVQKLDYGQKGRLGFAAFDIHADGAYLDYDVFLALCREYGVATVPELARGTYSLDFVKGLAGGGTTLPGSHIREGVVVRPTRERFHPRVGRVIFKYLNDDYLLDDKLSAADSTDL